MLLLAVVQASPPSHATVGRDWIVGALVASAWLPVQQVNVVEVAVTSQPEPDPVASPMSSACVVVRSEERRVRKAEKLTAGGAEKKDSEPAVSDAVDEVARASGHGIVS